MLSALGCGKRKPPLPPVERTTQRVEVTGTQQGDRVLLAWKMPSRNAPQGSVLNISRADVYRLVEPADSPIALSEEEFAARGTLIATLPVTPDDFGGKLMSFADTLTFAGQAARLRYAVRFVNAAGQKAAFSNFFLIEPTARVAGAPTTPAAQVTQTAVILSWTAPAANIDGSRPANVLGFNIYRSENRSPDFKLLNTTPISGAEFRDRTFQFEKEYRYYLRTVSLGGNGEPIESLNSEVVTVTPRDVFPPAAPVSITVAASPQTISIFFATNPEADIAGYNVYRSTDPQLSKREWTRLNQELLTTNTFQDTRVETGRTYFYYLTAVDVYGNVSEPSEVVSETVP